jgi:MFS family permease
VLAAPAATANAVLHAVGGLPSGRDRSIRHLTPGRTRPTAETIVTMNQSRLFLGCFMSLIATAFGFAVRGAILNDWQSEFNLTGQQVGFINGAAFFPFAISIILFSLIVDKVGYGWSMIFAFVGHLTSTLMTIFAKDFSMLYYSMLIFALSNGVVEAVINPVVATVYDKNKTHWLNILHAGWPGGLVLGGLLAIGVSMISPEALPGKLWQWQMALVLLPTVLYGILLFGLKFPVQERVAAGVSYMDMLREFGTASCWIVCFLLIAGIDQVAIVSGGASEAVHNLLIGADRPNVETSLAEVLRLTGVLGFLSERMPLALAKIVMYMGLALVPTIIFGVFVRTLGRPMFVFLLFVMFLLATTELGTDSWIAAIMQSVLGSPTKGTLFLVYTSFIMFVLRFFAGPIVHRISPLGLLAISAAVASAGLYWLSIAGSAVGVLFLAATLYGFGKTFFWPTTLGVISEQYPKGGALMLNAIAGVGMLFLGTIGSPAIGILQDRAFDERMLAADPQIHQQVIVQQNGLAGPYNALDQEKRNALPKADQDKVALIVGQAQQSTLGKIAILPAIMFVCYLLLIGYFRSQGGYKAQVLTGHAAEDEKFTGGVKGAVEA